MPTLRFLKVKNGVSLIDMSNSPKIFTLKQVVSSIRKTIEERYQQLYWVKVEMHKLNQFASGHCFPELLQKEDGKIVAQISGSIWKHNFERINKRFIDVVKEPLKEDTTLLMQVKVNYHEVFGLSLQIMDIDPNYSLGELQKERQNTLAKLQKEGLLNLNQQVHFPLLPKRIAVISADSSKGLSDFYQVIDNNEWGYTYFKMLFPAYLQGDNAADSIIHQLNEIKKVKHHFDVVVIVRGGGGEVGLSCYNNFELCKAIACFPIPILTGIGHSTNLTVAEMVSYRNAITPTELGDFLIQAFHQFSLPVKEAISKIGSACSNLLLRENTALTTQSKLFRSTVRKTVSMHQQIIDTAHSTIQTNLRYYIKQQNEHLTQYKQKIYHNASYFLAQQKNQLVRNTEQLPYFVKNTIQQESSKLEAATQSVRLMDPINVLRRGYSITTINGKTIKNSDSLHVGDEIQTKTATFSLQSTISKIDNKNE